MTPTIRATTRVRWTCPVRSCDRPHLGRVWEPDYAMVQACGSLWRLARALKLTADPKPEPGMDYVMVHPDDRPGVLEVHRRDELEFISEEKQ